MDTDLKILVTGALLHDIGKFAQRASRPYSKELEGEYLPTFKGKPSHWHALYTDYFIEHDLPLPNEISDYRNTIARIAGVHHRPDSTNLLEMCIMIADRLSSGSDRLENTQSESVSGFRESRLISVFDEIELKDHAFEPPGNWYHKLTPLEAGNDDIFPNNGKPEGPPKDYETLFSAFQGDLAALKTDNGYYHYLEGLKALMEKYTWCVPSSSYKTLADIPLYDHAHSTACIAQALYLYHLKNDGVPQWQDDQEKFILMGGDLSGIQNYIFGISRNSGRGVSKIFRARSFYLQALTRSVLLEIYRALRLYSVCCLIDSGGKFFLLLPNQPETVQQLETLNIAIQDWFRRRFKGVLTLNLAYSTRLAQQDFQLANFRAKLDDANEALEAAKLQKLQRTLASSGTIIDQDYDEMQDGNCALCSVNAADAASIKIYNAWEGGETSICKECCDQITYIGTRLPRTEYLLYSDTDEQKGKIPLYGGIDLTMTREMPASLGGALHVEAIKGIPGVSHSHIATHLPRITDEELKDQRWFDLFQKEEGFDDLVKAEDDFKPKTFNMIAIKSKQEGPKKNLIGRPLLGFLKADVDNLGLIFSIGFGERLSIARLASASRMLNYFFSQCVVDVLNREFPDIYIVFSGGDDLFLVGPWHETIKFAQSLRERLSDFCAQNTDITLSGGLFISKPRFPMRKAVENAEYLLDQAKQHQSASRQKDSLSILGKVLSWEEIRNLIKLGHTLDRAVKEKERSNFSTAFLHRLLTYHRMYLSFNEQGKIKDGRYLSHAHYDIARNIKDTKKDNQEELDLLYKIFAVGVDERPILDTLNVPLFYAINLNREGH